MLWTTLQIARGHSEDRFQSSTKPRKSYHQHLQYLCRSRRSDFSVSSIPPLIFQENAPAPETPDPADTQTESEIASRSSNLDRFLESTSPSVQARYLSKRNMGGCRRCDAEYLPYFVLGELWDSFKEWSAYGASVPLVLNGDDCVVQYYVPYLSGIQLYGQSTAEAVGCRMDGFSSNCHETEQSDGTLLFEFLEKNAPHSRKPLADKISDLACHFPELISLRSCDLSPISWISVAWYPIYRIPTGTTLKGLDACFLAFYYLSTQMKDGKSSVLPVITYRQGSRVPSMSLSAFGLASYKFKGSMWTPPNEKCGEQLTCSLLKAADDWLRLLQVDLSDYLYFTSHGADFHG